MANRLPSKSLEGKRIMFQLCPHCKRGDIGTITKVDTTSGDVTVELANGTSITVNWEKGDRWAIVVTAKPYSYA